MVLFRILAVITLGRTLIWAADVTPEYQGSKPIRVAVNLTVVNGKSLQLHAVVQNNTDEQIDDVRLCLKLKTDNDCSFEWSGSKILPHSNSAPYDRQLLVADKAKLKTTKAAPQLGFDIEIQSLTWPPATPARVAQCGQYSGVVKFDVDWSASPTGWVLKPYLEEATTKQKIFFDGLSEPSVPVDPYRSRWTFLLELPGATTAMKPDFQEWNCPSSGSMDISMLAKVTVNGQEIPIDFQWAPDLRSKRPALFKLLGKLRPTQMTLKLSEVRVDKIVSIQNFGTTGWKDLLPPSDFASMQPHPGATAIRIPLPLRSESQVVRVSAVTHFEGNPTQTRIRFFCFPLGAPDVDLDSSEKGENCVDNARDIRFHVTTRGKIVDHDVTFYATGPRGGQLLIVGPNSAPLHGKQLPEELRLRNDPDFRDGSWDIRGSSDVTIALEPKERTLTLRFTDENDNLIEEVVEGRVMVTNESDATLSSSPPYHVTVRATLRDQIRVAASSSNYVVEGVIEYDGTGGVKPLRMNRKPPLQQAEKISISLRPYFRIRAKEQLIDGSVKITYSGLKGNEQAVLRRDQDSFSGELTRLTGTPLAASIDLSPGQARILSTQSSYPVENRPSARQPIQLNFNKPVASVVVNPSQRFQRAKEASWLDDIKFQSWRVFQELNGNRWDDLLGYRYYGLLREPSRDIEILKQVETTALEVNAELRQSIMGNIAFDSLEVPPTNAAQSYEGFLNGFSYAAGSLRGMLIYIQAVGTAPLELGDGSIDKFDLALAKQGIRAVVVQFSPGVGEPRVLTQTKHRNLRLLQFYMETEAKKSFFAHAFDQVLGAFATLREPK